MKQYHIFLIIALCVSLHAPALLAGQRDGIVSISAGSFEMVKSQYNAGSNFELSLTKRIFDYFGYGADIGIRRASGSSNWGMAQNELDTLATELLFYIQPNKAKFQPFIAGGIGRYRNELTINQWGMQSTGSGTGYGAVIKGGLRYFAGDRFFFGITAKHFRNEQEIHYVNTGQTVTENLGGTLVNAEIGISF